MSQIEALSSYQTGNARTQEVAEKRINETTAEAEASQKEVKAKEDVDVVAINEAVGKINSELYKMRREERQFQIDEDLGELVVKIINSDTKELVRQIPNEDVLALSKRMKDVLKIMYG